jgi:FG-GAP repeat
MRMRQHIVMMVLVSATLLSSHSALAQFSQQGPKLVGTGAVGSAHQGHSVSLSADGNTALVGGIGDNSNAGAAWVWTRSGGVWTQSTKLVGSGAVRAAFQGFSVSLSADGNTAIVVGDRDNGNAGAAWVWTRGGGVWTQQGTKLVGSGGSGDFVHQGRSVSLSADGNTAIVGGIGDNLGAGAAWVWTRSGRVWTQQSKLVGSGASPYASQGSSVSLSADGNTAIVGGYGDHGAIGAAWVWTRNKGVWTQQSTKLVGSGAVGISRQGDSVSLSADGNTAIVGGMEDNSFAGAAWIWTRTAGVWTQQGPKLVGSGAVGAAEQGWSVSLSADGNTAIVGGRYDNSSAGAAWVWTRSAGVWTQQGTKLVGSGAVGNAYQGHSVSLSADGNTAIVGGPNGNAAWV